VYTNFITIGNKKYIIVYPKGRKRWVVKKLLEDKDYTYLHALLDDVIEVRQNPDRHTFEVPNNIPRNIALIEKPPKQQAVDAHITRFTKHPQNK